MHVRTSEQMTTHLFIYPLFFDNTFFYVMCLVDLSLAAAKALLWQGEKNLKDIPFPHLISA